MGQFEDRLDALEARAFAMGQSLGTLSSEALRSRRTRDAATFGDLVARLAPGPLTGSHGVRGAHGSRTPELGSPLLSRLRDDAMQPAYSGGRVDAHQGFANLLSDPTFESMGPVGIGAYATIGTAYTSLGAEWEIKYVLNSGTVATTRTAGRLANRLQANFAYGSSGVAEAILIFGTAASSMTVYLRPKDAYSADATTISAWLTASVRVACADASNVTATALVEIVDGSDTVLVSGDPDDLVALFDVAVLSRAQVGFPTPVLGDDYRMRVRLDVTKTAGAVGNVDIQFSEPLLAFSMSGSAPTFTPAVGGWLPGSPGLQLVPREFGYLNMGAGATFELWNGDISVGLTRANVGPWAGSIVGMSYRMSAAVGAGTLALKAQVNGSNVWTAFPAGALGQTDMFPAVPGAYPFIINDVVGIEATTSGGITAGLDINATLWLLVGYTGL